MMYKRLFATVIALGLAAMLALPALACGGLVAPNGSIRLARATTLVAWHDGIEHYLTSFTYEGDVANLGWIVPLPAVPDKIEEGGAWTLQRLERESHPITPGVFAAASADSSSAQVLQQVKVEALDITVVRGSGQAVIDWATGNGFAIDAETHAHLLGYAKGSPIFMAAKYDTAAAKARKQLAGDGAPVLITMHVAHPWVPLEVLALDGQQVQADLYLLTDTPVNTNDLAATAGISPVGNEVPGAPGFTLAFEEQINDTLFHDLVTDRNMGWVWRGSWLTYLTLDAPYNKVTYDMSVSSRGIIHIAPFGTAPMEIVEKAPNLPTWLPLLPFGTLQIALVVAIFLGVAAACFFIMRAPKPAPSVDVDRLRQQKSAASSIHADSDTLPTNRRGGRWRL